MVMANQLVMTIGSAANSAPLSGTPGQPAAGKQGDFSAALIKLLGADVISKDPANQLSTSLSELMGGLAPKDGQIQEQPDSGDQTDLINHVLEENPELLAGLLNMPQFQQWLMKAQPLLLPDAQTESGGAAVGNPMGIPQVSDTGSNSALDQAMKVVTTLLQSVKQEPESTLFRQLLDDLTNIVAPAATVTVAQSTNAGGGQTGTAAGIAALNAVQPTSVNNVSNTAGRLTGNHAQKKTATTSVSIIGSASSNRAAYNVKPEPAIVKLEALAAKSASGMPQVLTLSAQSDSGSDSSNDSAKLVPFDAGSTTNLNLVPDSSLIQTLKDSIQTAGAPAATDAKPFVQDMSQFVIKNMKVLENGGLTEAKFSLTPASLGHVDVKITMHEGQVIAHFVAQTTSGKEMLESQLPQLRQTLQSLGLQVERLDVSQQSTLSSGMFQEQRGGQSFQQQARQQKNGSARSDSDDFASELQTIADFRNIAYGTQFNVTA